MIERTIPSRWSLLTKLGLLDVIRHREGDQTLEHGVSDIEGDGLAIQVKMEMIQDDIEHNPTATMLDRDEVRSISSISLRIEFET